MMGNGVPTWKLGSGVDGRWLARPSGQYVVVRFQVVHDLCARLQVGDDYNWRQNIGLLLLLLQGSWRLNLCLPGAT
jgi:hypothetical protein